MHLSFLKRARGASELGRRPRARNVHSSPPTGASRSFQDSPSPLSYLHGLTLCPLFCCPHGLTSHSVCVYLGFIS